MNESTEEEEMLFTEAMFVGVGPTAGKRPIQYAVLDADLKIQVLDATDFEGVLAIVAGLDSPVVAIGSPQGPNKGLMTKPEVRRRYNLRPNGRTWAKWRVCEYELRKRNIRMYNTPDQREDAPRWIRNGYKLYRRLGEMGFHHLKANDPVHPSTMLEVLPHACYAVLLERRPFLKNTLEGRLQRQLVLYLEDLKLPNPIRTLEEITRHHILSGHLPLDGLHTPEELDALVSAYTAYLGMINPERLSHVGDREEGWIFLPTSDLRDFYV
jgi:predicted nuclease with RNAse H fold